MAAFALRFPSLLKHLPQQSIESSSFCLLHFLPTLSHVDYWLWSLQPVFMPLSLHSLCSLRPPLSASGSRLASAEGIEPSLTGLTCQQPLRRLRGFQQQLAGSLVCGSLGSPAQAAGAGAASLALFLAQETSGAIRPTLCFLCVTVRLVLFECGPPTNKTGKQKSHPVTNAKKKQQV